MEEVSGVGLNNLETNVRVEEPFSAQNNYPYLLV